MAQSRLKNKHTHKKANDTKVGEEEFCQSSGEEEARR
jgi:hypothetical protein